MVDNYLISDELGEGNIPPFDIMEPEQLLAPLVFNSPHSGDHYPETFLDASLLNRLSIRQSEDYIVDRLFEHVVEHGVPLMCGNYARAYLDINREPYELDPKMFSEPLPSFANTDSIRVAGGLGTIARIVSDRQNIYREKLTVNEALSRIEHIYHPYHDAMRRLLAKTYSRFGTAILIDCHSMPSPKESVFKANRPDMVIGDRYGTSSAAHYVHSATEILRELGYKVAVNKPYAGGFITEHYGRPADGLHAIQLEINRGLYMDERTIKPNDNFSKLKADLEQFVTRLISCCHSDQIQQSYAAE